MKITKRKPSTQEVIAKRLKIQAWVIEMTYEDLSRETNLAISTIHQYLTGKRIPRVDDFLAICAALKLNPCEVLKS